MLFYKIFGNKLTTIVVAILLNATIKNFNNASKLIIILYHRCCLLFRMSCENINNLQMPISHARIVQIGQLRCILTSTFL